MARDYKPQMVKKQFSDVAKISREKTWQPKVKMNFKGISFLTEFTRLK